MGAAAAIAMAATMSLLHIQPMQLIIRVKSWSDFSEAMLPAAPFLGTVVAILACTPTLGGNDLH